MCLDGFDNKNRMLPETQGVPQVSGPQQFTALDLMPRADPESSQRKGKCELCSNAKAVCFICSASYIMSGRPEELQLSLCTDQESVQGIKNKDILYVQDPQFN